ncbi:MAG: hypothetical protein MPK62_14075, partial [Alphaproteobacteria bacterium]|nr:hypothetical protein [Alphaproteobacteria bacterium]
MTLIIRGREEDNVFSLLGRSENSATYALGWALSQCPSFLDAFVEKLTRKNPSQYGEAVVSLQKYDKKHGGFTDVEIQYGDKLHIVVEAKKYCFLPAKEQIKRYKKRLDETQKKNESANVRLVTVSAMGGQQANIVLDGMKLDPKPQHVSWNDVRDMSFQACKKRQSDEQKRWLDHLHNYLKEFAMTEDLRESEVFVVSLSKKGVRKGSSHTYVDVVEKDGRYFHPVGVRGWPRFPVRLIGFRYDGHLQSVHQVRDYEVVSNIANVNSKWHPTLSLIHI